MAKARLILAFFLTLSINSAEAGQNVLSVQSIPIAPYEQVIKGFERFYGSPVARLFMSDLKEKDILKAIRKTRPDMILAVGRDALLSVRSIETIPVVYCMVLNPRSLNLHEKNISGISMNPSPDRQLKELLLALPAIRKVSLLYNPDQTGFFVQEVQIAAAKMGINLTATVVHRPQRVPSLLKNMKGRTDIFWMLPDATVLTQETVESMLLFSLENNMPILTFSEKYLDIGAMMSIGIDPFDIGSQAGEMAQKIFSGSDLKDERHVDARKALISINLKIADKLGIHIDQRIIKSARIIR